MDEAHIPADYAIDALSMETDRRGKAQGRPYSYGQLIADTTREQREELAEDYRKALISAKRRGRHRVRSGYIAIPETTEREIEDALIQKMGAETASGE